MEYLIVSLTALLASGLTLFSGFGLGSLLLPAFAIYFDIPTAVAMTAVIHFLNNVFKYFLVGKHARWSVVLKFGLPALGASFAGAWILGSLSQTDEKVSFTLVAWEFTSSYVDFLVGILILVFAVFELITGFKKITIPARWLPVGGVASGLCGGLSGHQGALRSAFLISCNLSKECFIGTNVIIALMVDVARLSVYGVNTSWQTMQENWLLIATGLVSAFIGAWLGARFMKKVTLRGVQILVAVMLLGIGLGLVTGKL